MLLLLYVGDDAVNWDTVPTIVRISAIKTEPVSDGADTMIYVLAANCKIWLRNQANTVASVTGPVLLQTFRLFE